MTNAEPRRSVRDALDLVFMDQLTSTPEGRHHLLTQVADAETSGEAAIFEQALARVEDPDLQRMIQRHQADELQHAELFYQRVDATGLPRTPVPEGLKMLERLDEDLGRMLERKITDRQGVMEAYLLLQVIEERAVTQFSKFKIAFEKNDPETAAVFAQVIKDEERHLLYCHAVSKRYAPDEQTRLAALERLRRAEAAAFKANQVANVRHIVKHKLIPGAGKRFGWWLFSSLASALPVLPLTPFYGSEKKLPAHTGKLAAA